MTETIEFTANLTVIYMKLNHSDLMIGSRIFFQCIMRRTKKKLLEKVGPNRKKIIRREIKESISNVRKFRLQ